MIVTVAQQKGGVGKTTTAISLATIAARAGKRVLAVDIDPQFALTRQIGVDYRALPLSLVDVLAGRVTATDAIVADVHGVDVLPATRELAGVELALVGEMSRESFLADAIQPLSYDLIVIDTPPNLGLLTVNALVPADIVIAPVSAGDEGAAQGLAELRATISKLKRLRPTPPELAVILTKWQRHRVIGGVIEDAILQLDPEHAPIVRVPMRQPSSGQQSTAYRSRSARRTARHPSPTTSSPRSSSSVDHHTTPPTHPRRPHHRIPARGHRAVRAPASPASRAFTADCRHDSRDSTRRRNRGNAARRRRSGERRMARLERTKPRGELPPARRAAR